MNTNINMENIKNYIFNGISIGIPLLSVYIAYKQHRTTKNFNEMKLMQRNIESLINNKFDTLYLNIKLEIINNNDIIKKDIANHINGLKTEIYNNSYNLKSEIHDAK